MLHGKAVGIGELRLRAQKNHSQNFTLTKFLCTSLYGGHLNLTGHKFVNFSFKGVNKWCKLMALPILSNTLKI